MGTRPISNVLVILVSFTRIRMGCLLPKHLPCAECCADQRSDDEYFNNIHPKRQMQRPIEADCQSVTSTILPTRHPRESTHRFTSRTCKTGRRSAEVHVRHPTTNPRHSAAKPRHSGTRSISNRSPNVRSREHIPY